MFESGPPPPTTGAVRPSPRACGSKPRPPLTRRHICVNKSRAGWHRSAAPCVERICQLRGAVNLSMGPRLPKTTEIMLHIHVGRWGGRITRNVRAGFRDVPFATVRSTSRRCVRSDSFFDFTFAIADKRNATYRNRT